MPSIHRHLPAALLCRAALTLALLAVAIRVSAGNLQVTPILLEFSDDQQTQVLWLENSGDQPLHAQVRVQHWSQPAASDLLQPSQALLASPAIVQIDAGQRQLVRIVRPEPHVSQQEQAYRLLVDELPGAHPAPQQGLQFLLRYSIPVFVLPGGVPPRDQRRPAAIPAGQLQARWQVQAGQLSLNLYNSGAQRVRLSQLSWHPDNGPAITLTPGLLGYVLAGQQMQWTLPLPATFTQPGTLQARLDDAPTPQPLLPAVH